MRGARRRVKRGEERHPGRAGPDVAAGHLDIVRALLQSRAGVDVADRNGATPLLFAAHAGFLDIVHALLEGRAAVNAAMGIGMMRIYEPIRWTRL